MNHRIHPPKNAATPACSIAAFTLLELLLAVTITAMLVVAVLSVFQVSLQAREEVRALGEPMTTGPRILDMIEEDLMSLWTFNIKDNRVFKGENRDFVGDDADRLHLIVAGETSQPVRLTDDSYRAAPYAEVSYLVKGSSDNSDHLELWRREDPLIDAEMDKGGSYQLLSNRVRSFNITYFEELGKDAEPFDEWDVAEKKTLPRRIKIELEIERSKDSFNKLREVSDVGARKDKFVRHVVFDADTVTLLDAGVAVIPAIPEGEPEPENALAGGGAAGKAGARGKSGQDKKGPTTITRGRAGNGGQTSADPIKLPGGGAGGNLNDVLRRLGGGAGGGNRGR